jgi:hypothetical protein
MTAPTATWIGSLGCLGASLALTGCTTFYEIPIETPIQPSFIAGGSEDVDANLETVRLLRSQLRTRAGIRVIEADVLPLQEIAQTQAQGDGEVRDEPVPEATNDDVQLADLPQLIADEQDLEAYERIFTNKNYWKELGQEFQNPLIVTGTVLFVPHQRSGYVTREQEVYDQFGRRQVVPVRAYMERKGFILRPRFVFIDGSTGETLYSESFREEVLYHAQQNTPALSSYFELMDRLVPTFLNTLSAQRIRGTRVLIK